MIPRRAILLAALMLVPATAGAKPERTEFYNPLQPVVIEFWDRNGMFHLVNIDLIVVYAKEGVKIANKVSDKIGKELAMMPWEDFNRDNPAVIIKRLALEFAKADPNGEHVKDVLISKLMIR